MDKKSFPHLKIQWLSPCSTYLVKPTRRKQIAVFHLVGATLFKLIGARIILLPFLSFLPFLFSLNILSFFPFISHSSLYFPLLPFLSLPFLSPTFFPSPFIFSVQLLFLLPLIFFFSIFSFFLSFFFFFISFFPAKMELRGLLSEEQRGEGMGEELSGEAWLINMRY